MNKCMKKKLSTQTSKEEGNRPVLSKPPRRIYNRKRVSENGGNRKRGHQKKGTSEKEGIKKKEDGASDSADCVSMMTYKNA